jgi:hypothetical protein
VLQSDDSVEQEENDQSTEDKNAGDSGDKESESEDANDDEEGSNDDASAQDGDENADEDDAIVKGDRIRVREQADEHPIKKPKRAQMVIIPTSINPESVLDYSPYISYTGNESQAGSKVYLVAGLQLRRLST